MKTIAAIPPEPISRKIAKVCDVLRMIKETADRPIHNMNAEMSLIDILDSIDYFVSEAKLLIKEDHEK